MWVAVEQFSPLLHLEQKNREEAKVDKINTLLFTFLDYAAIAQKL